MKEEEEEEEEEEEDDDESPDPKPEIAKLCRRWELASVLNFFNVFEPVIGNESLLSAEEIETGLVKPDDSLAKLNVKLLKGIPPVSKLLNRTDGWVTVLGKKLAIWWPWVAEGEIPLVASRGGEEISRYYKELDPLHRLLLLRALCEVRADQVDAVSYINSELKRGAHQVCSFRKDKIGGDGNISYWCDGNAVTGHRLYKQVIMTKRNTKAKAKAKGKACKATPPTSYQWETHATNLQEFHQALEELSCSRSKAEASVCKNIETDVLPQLEKLQKKKDRALKRKQTQEKLLSDVRANYTTTTTTSTTTGLTRSCRTRRVISYTFDEYDRAIDEAIRQPKRRRMVTEQKTEAKRVKQATSPSDDHHEESDTDVESKGKGDDDDDDQDEDDQSNSSDGESGSRSQREVDDEDEENEGASENQQNEEEEDEEEEEEKADDSGSEKNDENGNQEHSNKSSDSDKDDNEIVDEETGDDDQSLVDSSPKSQSVAETKNIEGKD